MIPYAPLQQIKNVVDVMEANAKRIVDEKLDAIKRKDDAVLAQIGGGKDILSTFRELCRRSSHEEVTNTSGSVRGNMDEFGNMTLSKEELVAQVSWVHEQ